MLSEITVESLLAESSVKNILGTNRDINETDSLRFYKNLQKFVDSNEKSMGDKKDREKKTRDIEYWPLIRVVKYVVCHSITMGVWTDLDFDRLYVKSPILATGAVIVDLPGVHDANAARAAVAESYMQSRLHLISGNIAWGDILMLPHRMYWTLDCCPDNSCCG